MNPGDNPLCGLLFDFARLYNEKIMRQYEDSYKDTFTSLQFFVLSVMRAYGEMTMTALCEKSGIRKQHATKLIDQLVHMGYAQRKSDESDRRVVRICLSPLAEEYFERHTRVIQTAVSGLFESLSEEETNEFRDSIERLNALMSKMPSVGYAGYAEKK